MRALVITLAFAATGTTSSAGPCAIRGLAPYAMTADHTPLPPGGGVLVALGGDDSTTPGPTDLTKTGWTFAGAGAPTIRVLAPGLVVYEPPAKATKLELVDGTRTIVSVTRGPAKPLLPAPQVTAVSYKMIPASGPRQPDRSAVTATLTGERPVDAVAVIVFEGGKPASWVSAFLNTGPKGPLELWHTAGRCETQLPGSTPTLPGAKVTLAWVDAAGRVGAHSKPRVVVAR